MYHRRTVYEQLTGMNSRQIGMLDGFWKRVYLLSLFVSRCCSPHRFRQVQVWIGLGQAAEKGSRSHFFTSAVGCVVIEVGRAPSLVAESGGLPKTWVVIMVGVIAPTYINVITEPITYRSIMIIIIIEYSKPQLHLLSSDDVLFVVKISVFFTEVSFGGQWPQAWSFLMHLTLFL